MSIATINPVNNQLVQSFDAHSAEYVEAALERSSERYNIWRDRSFEYRAGLFNSLADLLRDRKQELAQLMALEMGKVLAEGIAEIEKCALVCNYYAGNASKFLEDKPLDPENGKAFVSYEPLGCILAVMPWNFPFWQVFRFAAPTLMAGNTAILKHASNVPQCALAIEQLFSDAGFLPGAFQTLLISSDEVEKILRDDRIKGVSLTGSEYAGSKVAAIAGETIKPSLLELGGSDAFIVLEDADLDKAARAAAKSRMINCGQSCIAAKRFIIHQKIYDEFVKSFKAFLSTYEPGDPLEKGVKCGPMASVSLMEELNDQVKKSIQYGAKALIGGNPSSLGGAYYEPTILVDIHKDTPAYKEELFGPVASLFKVKDVDEAVALANDSKYGLGGSVWTRNQDLGIEIARRIVTGAVFINEFTASQPALPFGGTKISGYGRELSDEGIKAFVNAKTIYLA